MANMPSLKLVSYCYQDEEVEGSLAQYGRDGGGDGAVAWVLGSGGAALRPAALLWFRGESGSKRWRVSE